MSDRPPVALTAPLEGASLIEASAGTGKTWTIAGLFVRLVVEAGLSVEKILAVTFTRAATAELRERIRRKLQDTLETLQGRPALDPYCLALARRLPDPGLAIARLTAALRGFDDAPIYTIHGYCQRVLGDRAFSTGMPFDSEVLPSVDELLVEVVQDYWRTRVALPVQGDAAAAQELFVAWLLERSVTPDALRTWVKFQLARHGMRVVCKTAEGDRSALAGRLAALKPRLAAVWAGEREAIVALLETSPNLNWQKYRRDWIGKWADKVDEYFLPGAGP